MKWWIRILLNLLLLTVTIRKLYAQTASTQQADTSLKQQTNPSRRAADSLFRLGSHYQETQAYQPALAMLGASLKLYRLIDDTKKVGDCFNTRAITYFYLGNFAKAIADFKQGATNYQAIGYRQGVASTLNNIGAVYKNQGNYLRALDAYTQAARVWGELKNAQNLATTTQNIGAIYAEANDYGHAMTYYRQAYAVYRKKNNQEQMAEVLDEIGKIYTKQARYRNAFESLNQSLQLADKRQNKQLQLMALSSLGNLFFAQSAYAQALSYYKRSLTYADQLGSRQNQADAQIAIGTMMHRLGKSQDAIKTCRSGFLLAEKVGAVSLTKRGCDCLYESYKSVGKARQALHYYELANRYEDSLNIAETASRVMAIEVQKRQLVDSIAYVRKEHATQLKHKEEVERQQKQRNLIGLSLGFILLVAAGLGAQLSYVRRSRAALKVEKDRSETLLLNILPEAIAEELKEKGQVAAREYSRVSILFTDFKSFTQTAEQLSPHGLVAEIHACFKAFDELVETYQIEKIKTIGDAYMAAGGLSSRDEGSLKNIVLAGLAMQEFMASRAVENKAAGRAAFEMRLGIHTGPIVAGIVGVKKFQYDVWGDTVNTASRMESSGLVGRVNISQPVYELIKDEACFSFEYRGQVAAKGKGEMGMYFVGRRDPT